jgi:hypothetical protein
MMVSVRLNSLTARYMADFLSRRHAKRFSANHHRNGMCKHGTFQYVETHTQRTYHGMKQSQEGCRLVFEKIPKTIGSQRHVTACNTSMYQVITGEDVNW